MTTEFDKYDALHAKLEQKYPKMFSQPYGGVAIGEGWFPIIESLCQNIQAYVDWKQEQQTKYNRGEGCVQPVVAQIKEKFGGLRFYYDGGDSEVSGMVRMAEAWADHTCERCGSPATRRGGGWVRTLCDQHEAEYQKQRKQYDA